MRLRWCLFACSTATTAVAGQDRLSGTWQGYWSRAGDTMAVTMLIHRDSTAAPYAATFGADRLRVSGIPFAEVQLQGCCDSPSVAFVIASAAAGLPLDSVELFSVLNAVYPAARTAEDSASARAYVTELVAVAYHGRSRAQLDSLVVRLGDRPWFFQPPAPADAYWSFSKTFGQYRPLDWWAQGRVPVLLVYGAEDKRVPAALAASS